MEKSRIKNYLADIANQNPEAIIITGDLVSTPREKNFELAFKFIDYLGKRFDLISVPGNTDYSYYGVLEKNSEPLSAKRVQIFNSPIIPSQQNRFIIKNIVTIKNKYYGCFELLNKNSYIESDSLFFDLFFSRYSRDLKLEKINITGLDSVKDISLKLIGKFDDEKGNFYLGELHDGEFNIDELDKKVSELDKSKLNFAVFHHPLLKIPGANPIHGTFANNYEVASIFLKNNLRFTLSGHKHLPGYNVFKHDNFEKTLYSVTANTLFSRDIKKPYKNNSYNLIEITDEWIEFFYREIDASVVNKIVRVDL
jgi:3',5'-cyclic AMP phosphodiesterase CpdA